MWLFNYLTMVIAWRWISADLGYRLAMFGDGYCGLLAMVIVWKWISADLVSVRGAGLEFIYKVSFKLFGT